MPSSPPDGGSSRHSAGLLLRVQRPDGHADEFYLAGGLTIGRSVANAVVLADDDAVDRAHARVEVAADGTARLRCIEPQGSLTTGGDAVHELPLEEGRRFRIGRTEFECVAGRRGPGPDAPPSWSACPFCASTDVATAGGDIRQCPACNAPVLPVRPDPHGSEPILLPAFYGDYRAERYVARGGMGLVLKGAREGGTEPVAIKVLLPGTLADRRGAVFFEREVVMMARVRHPNVVKLLDHGKSGRYNFLALEWIEGPSLREVIADANRAGKLTDFAAASRWLGQVGKGLAAIHAVGMIHRDLKPSNILIGPDGVARVADLGIAKRIDAAHTSYTTTGHAPGTFEYMAPEQHYAPDTVEGRADLYALGVSFYELLIGMRPVGAWSPASEVNLTVPRLFDEVLGRLMAPRPTDRYADIHELLAALIEVARTMEGTHVKETRPCTPKRTRPEISAADASLGEYSGPVRVAANEASRWVLTGATGVAGTACFAWLSTSVARWLGWVQDDGRGWGIAGGITVMAAATAMGAVGGAWLWACDRSFLNLNRWLLGGTIAGLLLGPVASGNIGFGVLVCGPIGGVLAVIGRMVLGSTGHDAASYVRWAQDWSGSPALVVACLTEAARLDPSLATASFYIERSLVHRRRGDLLPAVADLTEAIRLEPMNAAAYYERGATHDSLFQHARSVADYTEAIRLRPGWVEAYEARATAHYMAAEQELAIADYSEIIRLRPDSGEPYASRGHVISRNRRPHASDRRL